MACAASDSGTISICGVELLELSPATALELGCARIPEDRNKEGLISELTIGENLLLEKHSTRTSRHGWMIDFTSSKQYIQDLIREYDIRPPISELPAQSLSGGKCQKIILARELSLQPKLIIASQPTRGLDVKAMNYIHSLFMKEKAKGTAIFLISEDQEIMHLSDRIAVIYEGEINKTFNSGEADRSQIGLFMAGIDADNAALRISVPE